MLRFSRKCMLSNGVMEQYQRAQKMPSKRCNLPHDIRASYSTHKFEPGDLVRIRSRQSSMIGIAWNSLGVIVEDDNRVPSYARILDTITLYSVLVDGRVIQSFYPHELRPADDR